MSKLNFFQKSLKKLSIGILFLCSLNVALQAQCTLTAYNSNPLSIVVNPGCNVNFLSPYSFLQSLDASCAAGVGTTFNLKIYNAAGITPIYDNDNAGGNNGVFPSINVAALNLGGQVRKVRITRNPGNYFTELNIQFVMPIMCPPAATVNVNDDINVPNANPALMPVNVSGCGIPLNNLCIVLPNTTTLTCADINGYQRINRTIKSSDNSTTACSQTIYIRKIDITQITAPANYTDATNKGCAFSAADRHPNNTKFPVLNSNGRELALANAQAGTPYTLSNVRITYTDALQTPACGGELFIRRTWTIEDICGASPNRVFSQDIKSQENTAPTIQPISAVTVNADPAPYASCVATNFKIPTAIVADNCSANPTVAVTISNGGFSLNTTNGATIASLASGTYNIRYTVSDACGANTVLNVPLTIVDATAPAIVCSAKMIALNNLGTASTNATTFIDYINDNCSVTLSSVQVKRMTDVNFGSTLNVTCADIGMPIMVQLRVTDLAGNHNFCMTMAEVQDKLAPSFVNLADTIVNCPVDTSFLKSLNPVVSDGCSFTLKKTIKDYNVTNCQTGTFKICYTATDASGHSSTITRNVTVVNPNPFTAAMITRPKDITIKNFNGNIALLDAEKLDTGSFAPARPKWTYTGCDLVGVSKNDDVYKVNGSDCCFKIVRTWKIANCCMMDPLIGGPKELATFVQVIKIEDTLPPEIKGVPADVTMNTVNCLANFTLPKPTFVNDCASTLPISIVTTTTTMPGKSAADPFVFNNVPKGVYTVTYRATDDCGNIGTTSIQVTVKDMTKPTAIAKHGIAANLDANGELMIKASLFNQGSKDNCTPDNKLIYTFSQNPADSTIMFDCNTFKPMCDSTTVAVAIRLWVRDEAGNWDFVDTYIAVSKNNTPCTCFKNIAGAIQTVKGDNVQDVLISIVSNGISIIKPVTTGINGSFSVPPISGNVTYNILPKKDKEANNGVTTADLVMMSKHILGQQLLTSPYQWIAADVNKSGKITTADVVELRKLILGLNTMFNNNQSWRFIDKSFQFVNTANPLSEVFPENKILKNINEKADFLAVKIGDVNGSAKANSAATGEAGTRSGDALTLVMNDLKIEKNQTYTIPVKVKSLEDIAAYQFTLNFDQDALEFIDVKDENNGADAAFGLTHLSEGVVTTSWMNPTSIAFKPMEKVFTLIFKGKKTGKLSNLLKISSDFTLAEAYRHDGEAMAINLEFASNKLDKFNTQISTITEFELYQNQPNPFRNNTVVSFNLPQASNAILSIYDQTGRLLKKINADFEKGKNEIKVNDLGASGLLFYRLDTPDHSATRKMLMID